MEWMTGIPPKPGKYYCKISGYTSKWKSSVGWDGEKWVLGSSLLLGAEVDYWLYEGPDEYTEN